MTINPLRSRVLIDVPERPTITKAQKIAIWNRENGLCWFCLKPVPPLGPDVIYDHKTPRALNGSDDPAGIFPIHSSPCNERKTHGKTGDIARVAKAKRQAKLTAPKVRKPGGFRGWRKMNGEIVWRNRR